ncbi:YfdX family protein [Dyella jejuensis]|uniref:YfdX family protein n=1 Tax=Dyella jejuensis TaxID=1432009 RepID=A0ABW8JJ44_9GAMM
MTHYRMATALALALACAAGAASADIAQAAAPASSAAATRDFQQLSEQGSQAFQDIEIARIAIFNGHPQVAVTLIKRAQLSLIKAESDGTAFDKAEADLKSPPRHANPAPAAHGAPVRWLPIGADFSLDQDYSADPAKAAAVAASNVHLKKGERDKAIETLRLANIKLSCTLALVPAGTIAADVDEAATLLAHGKYYEANLSLKHVQDSVRYDWVDLNARPAKNATAPVKMGLTEPVTSSTHDAADDAHANK